MKREQLLTRRFSSPALPDPGPLPASVRIPRAEPPEGMELIAVPTGVNNRVPPTLTAAARCSTAGTSTSARR